MLNKITILMGGIRGRPLNILRLFYDNNKDSVLPNGRISGGGGVIAMVFYKEIYFSHLNFPSLSLIKIDF